MCRECLNRSFSFLRRTNSTQFTNNSTSSFKEYHKENIFSKVATETDNIKSLTYCYPIQTTPVQTIPKNFTKKNILPLTDPSFQNPIMIKILNKDLKSKQKPFASFAKKEGKKIVLIMAGCKIGDVLVSYNQ